MLTCPTFGFYNQLKYRRQIARRDHTVQFGSACGILFHSYDNCGGIIAEHNHVTTFNLAV